MTDRVTEALLAALKQALAAGAEQRLVKSGKLDGLFPGRVGAAGAAAARALDEGLLEVVRTEVRGKAEFEWVRLTPRGVEFLHEHESPVHALHELRDTLRANQQAIPVWLADIRAAASRTRCVGSTRRRRCSRPNCRRPIPGASTRSTTSTGGAAGPPATVPCRNCSGRCPNITPRCRCRFSTKGCAGCTTAACSD